MSNTPTLDTRERLSPYQAAEYIAETYGEKVHGSQVYRWCTKGLKIRRDRPRTRMEHIRIGRRVKISPAAIRAFMEALAESGIEHPENDAPAVTPTSLAKQRASKAHARDVLKRAGIA